MKKIVCFIIMFFMVFCSINPVFAQDEYRFDLQYTGSIVKNIEKDAVVLLTGVGGTLYTNVQIKVDIKGPATPKLLATDATGVEHDIAQLGSWGPQGGFAIQGDFENKTPIKATFIEEGSYTITLSLIDLTNNNSVITSKVINLEVYEDAAPQNNIVENNVIQELPKTGTSIWEYVTYVAVLAIIFWMVGMYLTNKKIA
ncbi:MAG: hypothetical protein HFJ27_06065 [Clostridia bacterium]|nr:hypothetical protein [Clostridia bacterium]